MLMQARPGSCSYFFNDKKHSFIAMAVVNYSNYQFTMVDIDDAGRKSDGGVFASSNTEQALEEGLLNILPPRRLYCDTKLFPFVLVDDEAFPYIKYLIKHYARTSIKQREQVVKCKISRPKRVVENTFGICALKLRIFQRSIITSVGTVTSITRSAVALHNYLIHGRKFGQENNYCRQRLEEGTCRGQWLATTFNCWVSYLFQGC